MRNWELINYGKVLKIKIKILLNLFNVKYGLKVGESNNTLTGTERVKIINNSLFIYDYLQIQTVLLETVQERIEMAADRR